MAIHHPWLAPPARPGFQTGGLRVRGLTAGPGHFPRRKEGRKSGQSGELPSQPRQLFQGAFFSFRGGACLHGTQKSSERCTVHFRGVQVLFGRRGSKKLALLAPLASKPHLLSVVRFGSATGTPHCGPGHPDRWGRCRGGWVPGRALHTAACRPNRRPAHTGGSCGPPACTAVPTRGFALATAATTRPP